MNKTLKIFGTLLVVIIAGRFAYNKYTTPKSKTPKRPVIKVETKKVDQAEIARSSQVCQDLLSKLEKLKSENAVAKREWMNRYFKRDADHMSYKVIYKSENEITLQLYKMGYGAPPTMENEETLSKDEALKKLGSIGPTYQENVYSHSYNNGLFSVQTVGLEKVIKLTDNSRNQVCDMLPKGHRK